jgi:serine phosphatase RsbU (regulator of sigma subunit)
VPVLATTPRTAPLSALAGLHALRTDDELDRAFVAELAALAPGVPAAVCIAEDGGDVVSVRLAVGECPLRAGDRVEIAANWRAAGPRLPLRFRGDEFGDVLLGAPIPPSSMARLEAVVEHYATALANLVFQGRWQQDNESYAAKLLAVEECIALFQEEEPAAVRARLLQLAASLVQAAAGALYVLREVGNPESGLTLADSIGIPESLLASFHGLDAAPWPHGLIDGPVRIERRECGGVDGLAGLDPACMPVILQGVVVLPLRYHGVVAGVLVLFNQDVAGDEQARVADRLALFCSLAAALLHRLSLETLAAQSRTLQREMEIAESIQRRLLPTEAPPTAAYSFAWSSTPAQQIGGDFLDLGMARSGDVHAVIADASGHGINSALLMNTFRAHWRAGALSAECGPTALASELNGIVVHDAGATGMFVTAAFLRLACDGSSVRLCSAGHNPTLHWRAAEGRLDVVEADGPPLGFLGAMTYGARDVALAPGDVLLLFTDGISEATRDGGPMFGEDRLRAAFVAAADGEPAQILAAVQQALGAWTGRDRQDDDVSLLVVKVLGAPE